MVFNRILGRHIRYIFGVDSDPGGVFLPASASKWSRREYHARLGWNVIAIMHELSQEPCGKFSNDRYVAPRPSSAGSTEHLDTRQDA